MRKNIILTVICHLFCLSLQAYTVDSLLNVLEDEIKQSQLYKGYSV